MPDVKTIDGLILNTWLMVRVGLLPVGSLAGPMVMHACKSCGGCIGGSIAMGFDGPLDLVGKCTCGKRATIKCSRWPGWPIGGDQ